MEKKDKFLVRIVYKSGYTHDFWVYSFSVKNGTYTWSCVEENNKPVVLGADDIAAVWQIGLDLADDGDENVRS